MMHLRGSRPEFVNMYGFKVIAMKFLPCVYVISTCGTKFPHKQILVSVLIPYNYILSSPKIFKISLSLLNN